MVWWRESRWFVYYLDTCALLVMVDDTRVENVSIFDARPNIDFCLLLPFLNHCLQWNPNESTFKRCVRTQNNSHAPRTAQEAWLPVFIHRECALANHITNICGGGIPDIFPYDKDKILFDSAIPSAYYDLKALTENERAQLSFGGVAHMAECVLSGVRGADSSASGALHLSDGTAHKNGLRNEGDQLKDENTKLYNTDKNLIPSIFDQFPIIRHRFFRLYVLLFGIGLLFCGGYNIYRERLVSGAALIACGYLLGLLGLGVGLFLLGAP